MHSGTPTPFTPARNEPPPVPPPSPGPKPPPEPLPMPVPPPLPRESVTLFANGSPKFAIFGLGIFKSGGPNSDGSIASLGARFSIFACGGVNCVHLNLGSFPFDVGVRVWLFAPPPPPALSAPAGSFATYGEISSGVMSICLFFASVEGKTRVKIGITSNPNSNAPCRPKAIAWLQPNFSSFDQISFTLIGFTAKGRGACLGGEKNSLMRVPNPPKFDPQATANLLFTGPFGTGPELKKSLRLSPTPAPNDVFVKGASARSRTLIGRSMKNCFRFDQKLSGIRISGLTNFGTAEEGTGIAGSEPDTLDLVISGGRRLINLCGTVSLLL